MSKFYLAIKHNVDTSNCFGSDTTSRFLVDPLQVASYIQAGFTVYELDNLKEITKADITLS